MSESDLGRTVTFPGDSHTYTIAGLIPTNRKNIIQIQRDDGKRFVTSLASVKKYL